MFRNFESGKDKKRNPFDKDDPYKDDIWQRRDRLWDMLEARKTSDPHDNFFSTAPKRIALEGEIYYDKINKIVYVGNKKGGWSKMNGLKEVTTSFAGSAFVINSTLTGVGTALGSVENGGFALAENLKSFEATSFHPQGSYEFNKITSGITDGKIYVQGTAKSVSALKTVANVAIGLGVVGGILGIYLSLEDWNNKKISGQILMLDIIMTGLSLTGAGAFPAGVYFILIRTDTKDKYFTHKPENIHESTKVKIDNTRIDRNIYKIIKQ